MKNFKPLNFMIVVFLGFVITFFPSSFSLTSGNSPDWIDISEAIEGDPATTLCIHPEELNTLYVGLTNKGIYKTSTHGETWELFNEGLNTENSKKINVLKIDPVDPNIMYLGTTAGLSSEGSNWVVSDALFKSVDGGKTWNVSNKGIIPNKKYYAFAPNVHDIAIDSKNHLNVYIATIEGIYKSTDEGKNWTWSSTGIENSTSTSSIVIDPSNPEILYASGIGVYKSEDSGKTWDLLGLEDESIRAIVINPQNTDIIYAGGQGILKTTDGGKTWVDTGLTSKYDRIPFVNDIEILEGTPSTLYVATNLGIYKSGDGGESWVELAPSKLILFWSSNDIVLSQNGIIYSAANGFKDKPGGFVWMWQEEKVWTTSPSAPTNLIATASTFSITLNWSVSIQSEYPIQGYSIYKGTSSGGEDAILTATVDASTITYTDTDVTFGKTYYYYVKAFDNQNPPDYSSPSNEVSAALEDATLPALVIISPSNYSTVGTNLVIVKGTATDESGIDKVTVNGSEVSVASNGSFSKTVNLTEGINTITIIATDKEGNPTTKTVTVTYEKPVQTTTITLWPDNPMMNVNGVSQEIDLGRGTKPVIIPEWSRTVVPIRAIVEALGGTISWDGTERKVTINFKETIIELWIDNPKARVNGTEVWIDADNHNVKPIIINDRTMLPLRFVAESLGCEVGWNPDTKTITITYGG